MLFSRRNVNMAADVDFISMSRNGQLTGFCHALPIRDPKTKYFCAVLLTGMFHISVRSGPNLSGTQ